MERAVRPSIWFSMGMSLLLLVLLPLLYAGLMAASLAKLHISHAVAAQLVIAIVLGSFINIPITRISQPEELVANPLATFGLDQLFPRLRRPRRETVIAVNVGGCLIPLGIAAYQLGFLAEHGADLLVKTAVAALITTAVCYVIARPVPGLGIAMPGFVPPIVSALTAVLLVADQAPPVAFVAGVIGPLVGADLLHLRHINKVATTGVASIGGAGTFDGIVLSGILSAYLA
jgi:uncharacterized membrane protein